MVGARHGGTGTVWLAPTFLSSLFLTLLSGSSQTVSRGSITYTGGPDPDPRPEVEGCGASSARRHSSSAGSHADSTGGSGDELWRRPRKSSIFLLKPPVKPAQEAVEDSCVGP